MRAGVLILDPDSIRTLDRNGRVISVRPLPRTGDTIRSTPMARANLVESQMYATSATAPLHASALRASKARRHVEGATAEADDRFVRTTLVLST